MAPPVIESSLDARIDAAVETYGTDREMLADFLKGVKTPVIVDEVIADKLLPYAEALAKDSKMLNRLRRQQKRFAPLLGRTWVIAVDLLCLY